MKKSLFAAIMMITFSGVAMAQVSPAKKHPAKTDKVQKSDTTSTASGTHKEWKKKDHSKKHS